MGWRTLQLWGLLAVIIVHIAGTAAGINAKVVDQPGYSTAAYKVAEVLGLQDPIGSEGLVQIVQAFRASCPSGAKDPTSVLRASDLYSHYSKGVPLDAAGIEGVCTAIMACQLDPTCTLEDPAAVGTSEADPAGDDGQVTMLLRGIVAFGLFIEALLGIYIPVWMKSLDSYEWWLSLLNCFSGGVFLAAGLVHLLPHCQEAQEKLGPLIGHYPLYLVLITLGYLLVLFVERVVFDVHGAAHQHGPHTGVVRSHSEGLLACSLEGEPCQGDDCEQHGGGGHDDHHHEHHHHHQQQQPAAAGGSDKGRQHSSDGGAAGHDHSSDGVTEPLLGGDHVHNGGEVTAAAGASRPAVVTSSSCGHHHHHHHHDGGLHQGMVLLGAMSVHTALECMALGLMSARKEFFMLVIAIASHKLISGLALSSRFLKEGATTRQITLLVGPFVFVAPISIFVGVFVRDVNPILNLALCCFATGTFIYVGASEIVEEEFEGDMRSGRADISQTQARYIKFVMLLLGVGSIALLSMVHDHHHDHDHLGLVGGHGGPGHHHHHHH